MKNKNIDLNRSYITNKDQVSRRNQDDTVIIMKTDNTNVFYKIDALAAQIWHLFQTPANPQEVLNALLAKFCDQPADKVKSDFNDYFVQLLAFDIVKECHEAIPSTKNEDTVALFNNVTIYNFGQIKEFDLAQIESEVLNESIYLDVFAGSDLRIKKNVEALKNPLEKILSLDGISYLWNENVAHPAAPKNTQIGLIAQQVAAVMPDLIKKDTETGILAVNYTKLTPYLVESIKELKNMIDAQNEKIAKLELTLKNTKH